MQKVGTFTVKIVTRTDKAKGFEVLPSGWVVERAFRMAGAMPQAGQGQGEIHRFHRSLDVSRSHSPVGRDLMAA
ncbi:transposase [Mesorhizobium robiniae]|uniref:Transposase n=1 Tax=Mesorhizobium robiniae TaxID=559315 RepID=A0ABV2GWQ1_9HYPH